MAPPVPVYRALTLFDDVPSGCILHPVTSEGNAPHLKLDRRAPLPR